ncbi:MAG: hypothetical protein WD768_20470 [Phycisphaeraceae bacterium]
MSNRPFLSVVVILTLITGFSAAQAQNEPTAEQLLDQGKALIEANKLDEAQLLLQRIDAAQLPQEKQVELKTAMQDIDRLKAAPAAPAPPVEVEAPVEPPPAPPTPNELMVKAGKQREAGNYAGAIASLEAAAAHADATAEDKAFIATHTAEIQRVRNAKVTAARQTIEQVAADLARPDADLDAAESKLRNVKGSDVTLNFFDSRRIDRAMAVIAERRAEAGQLATAQPVQPVQPVEPPVVAPVEPPVVAPVAPVAPEAPVVPVVPAGNEDAFAQAFKLVAQEKYVEGQEAERNTLYKKAVKDYGDALALDPSNELYKAALAGAEAKATSPFAPRDLAGKTRDEMIIGAAAAIAEYEELMNKADSRASARDYNAALDAIQQAKQRIDNARPVLGAAKYTELRNRAEDRFAQIERARLTADGQNLVIQSAQDAKDAQIRRMTAKLEQMEAVQRLLQRAADLRKEQDYERSLQLINQALFLSPRNPAAEAMKMMVEDSQIAVKAKTYMRERALRIARHQAEMIEATIPYNELITYPSDWPQLTAMRLGGFSNESAESEGNRRVQLKLQDPIPVNFEQNKVVNVVDYFRNTTGVNFFVNWAALEAAGVEQDLLITLQLNNVPAEQAIKLVLQQAGAAALEPIGFSVIDGVVHISTRRDLQRTTDTRVYDIRDLLVQIPNFIGAPEFDLNSALSNTSSGGSSGGGAASATTLFSDSDAEGETITRVEMIEQITTLIQDTIGVTSEWAAYGGEVSSLRELNGNLIVKSTPDNHRDIIRLLGQLRSARAMQIHIEARFLLVETNFLDELGVDLDLQYRAGGSFHGPIRFIQDSTGLSGRTDSGFPGNFGAPAIVPGGPIPAFSGGGTGPFGGAPFGAPNSGFGPAGTIGRSAQLDLGITFFDDLDVNLIIHATNASKRSISLTAPRLTLFNGQRSNVMVARQVAFISDLEPVSGGIGFDPTLSVTQSGVVLDVEATVSADRRYVTMTARPSLATLVQPIRSIPQFGAGTLDTVDGGGGGGPDPTILLSGFIEAPELELTQVRTSVSVPDKGTLLMGGQRLVADIEVEAGVPILSKIPVLNRFFTNTSHIKDERTLLILIKPTIIIQEEQEDALWPGILQDPINYNAGRGDGATRGIGQITGATP